MKKLIFLLLIAVALAGMVSAQDTAHPPGVLTLALSDYGDYEAVITPDTVSAVVPLSTELQAVFLAQPETIDRITGKPQTIYAQKPDYWLLL